MQCIAVRFGLETGGCGVIVSNTVKLISQGWINLAQYQNEIRSAPVYEIRQGKYCG